MTDKNLKQAQDSTERITTPSIKTRYQKENAVRNIRDYYNPSPAEAATGKHAVAFERAKAEYINALTAQLEVAKQITFADAFPKAA